jgi:DNA-binding IscR family transcriptional regulator
LADVRGTPPEQLVLTGSAEPLREVWLATRAALRTVLEAVTIADVAGGTLPSPVHQLLADPEAWARR